MTLARVGTPTTPVELDGVASGTITRTGVVVGSGLIVYLISDTAVTSLTDNGGAPLTPLKTQTCTDGPSFFGSIYLVTNASAGSHAFDLELSAAGAAAIWIDEWSGLFSATLDKSNGDGNYSNVHGAGAVGPLAQAVELVCLLAQNVHSSFGATTLPTQGGTWSQVATGFLGPSGFNSATLVSSAVTAITPVFTGDASNYEQANVIVTLIPGTAPSPATLTSPTVTSPTSVGATVGATTDTGSGTLYAVGYTGTQPSAAQIIAGHDASNAATAAGNVAVTSSGAKTLSLTGGAPNTTYNYALVQANAGGNSNVLVGGGTFTTLPPAPTITGLSSTTVAYLGSLTLTGTAFGSTQGTGSVSIGGSAVQTESAWSDTSATISSIARGALGYGATTIALASTSGGSSAPTSITLVPQAGWDYVTIGTPNTTAANRITSTPDLASGDQVAYDTKGGLVVMASDGTFTADPSVVSFNFEVWTPGSAWGSPGTATLQSTPTGTVVVISW